VKPTSDQALSQAACDNRRDVAPRRSDELGDVIAVTAGLDVLTADLTRCRRCARLVRCRERAAREPPKRFRAASYWAKPVPGFGDPAARLLVVGLAPAAHGANRTGRVFTGDRSGDWLYGALHRGGWANQAASIDRGDGLELRDAYVSCVVRCAPPGNKPTPTERDRCLPFLIDELRLLARVRAIVALGGFAWDGVLRALAASGHDVPTPRPKFGHGAHVAIGPYAVFGSYHVSQQNTFTGRLTEPMLDAVFAAARGAANRAR
jgi:uracil-DNA glycosylase family 4